MRALVVMVAVAACIPTHRAISAERGRLWVAPGSPQVFSWVDTVEHRTTRTIETTKDDIKGATEESDDPVRSAVYVIDPATRGETRLGGESGDPIFYDAKRGVLWVRDKDHRLAALAGGKAVTGPVGAVDLAIAGLVPPRVLVNPGGGGTVLVDLSTGASIALPWVAQSEVTTVGDAVRFTELEPTGEVVRVHQVAVDWSTGTPQRLPDVAWSTAPLPAAEGSRLGMAILRDGRYAEVVRGAGGTALLVYDVTKQDGAPIAIPLPAGGAMEEDAQQPPHLVTLAGDAVVFGEPDHDRCWRGAAVRVDRKLVVPLPADDCIVDAAAAGPERVLVVRDHGTAVVDPQGNLVTFESIDKEMLAAGLATGATARVVMHSDGRLEQVDLATGERRETETGRPGDRLLAVDGGIARLARGAGTVVSVPLAGSGSAAATTFTLGEPALARVDRMPRDRNEFWLGVGGGVGTSGTGVGQLHGEVAHWVTDQWTWVIRGTLRFEGDETMEQRFDGGASFGYAWHRLPRLASLWLEADAGASYSGVYVDNMRVDRAFAPSLEVHIGLQGKMIGLDAAAVAPSLIDFDRGVLFLVSAKIGFTENLH